MEEYKDISRGLKTLLDKAEEMGWNWEAYIEPDSRRTYVEIGQSSPAGEDFSMTIDFDEENQADSFKDSLESYYEDFDIDEHIEMWIEAKRSGTSGVPSTRELVKDAEAIDGMILELSQALQKVNIPVLVGSYTPPDETEKARRSSVSSTDRGISSKTKMRFTTDRMIRATSRNYPIRCTRETASCRSATSRTIWQRKFSRHWTGST